MSNAETPVDAGKVTLSRYAGLVTNLISDVGGLKSRLELLEKSDKAFKVLAVGLLVVMVVCSSWCGFEFHTLNETLIRMGTK